MEYKIKEVKKEYLTPKDNLEKVLIYDRRKLEPKEIVNELFGCWTEH